MTPNELPGVDELPTPHELEEKIRAENMALMNRSPDLGDHGNLIQDALWVLMTLCRKHQWQNDDARAIHLLGVRVYNTGSAALKLALSGYYQVASHLTRDLLETTNLLDYFSVESVKISAWRSADEKGRKAFEPFRVRKALEGHSRFEGQRRDLPYKRLSTYAAHPSHEGFRVLVSAQGQFEVGPFVDEESLRRWLLEAAAWLGEATLAFIRNLSPLPPELQVDRDAFVERALAWSAKYLSAP